MIYLTGDVNLSDGYFDTGIGIAAKIEKGLNPFEHFDIKEEDFWIANFESVCSTVSENTGTKAKQFRISPNLLKSFRHPNLYGVANNHVMQHGPMAYNEMLLNIRDLKSDYVGTLEKKSHIFSHQGKNIAVTAFSQRPENFKHKPLYWNMPEYSEIEAEYDIIKNEDFKIAYIHWGIEMMNRPYYDQIQFAHFLVDLGYDLIVGMHPHILQGFEIYNGKYIFYSLGNTIFNKAHYKCQYGGIVSVDFLGIQPKINYLYTEIGKDLVTRIVDENAVPKDCRFGYLNKELEKKFENEKYFLQLTTERKKYRKANYRKIVRSIPKLKYSVIRDMMIDFMRRKLRR